MECLTIGDKETWQDGMRIDARFRPIEAIVIADDHRLDQSHFHPMKVGSPAPLVAQDSQIYLSILQPARTGIPFQESTTQEYNFPNRWLRFGCQLIDKGFAMVELYQLKCVSHTPRLDFCFLSARLNLQVKVIGFCDFWLLRITLSDDVPKFCNSWPSVSSVVDA